MADELEVAMYEPAGELTTKHRIALLQKDPHVISLVELKPNGGILWYLGELKIHKGLRLAGGLRGSGIPFPVDCEGRIKVIE